MISLVYTNDSNKKALAIYANTSSVYPYLTMKLAGSPSSPSFDGMPGPTGFKQTDTAMERFVEAKEIIRTTNRVISVLPDVSQKVIRGLIDGLPEHSIAFNCGYGYTQYYSKIRPHALYLFSLYYPLDTFDEKDNPA